MDRREFIRMAGAAGLGIGAQGTEAAKGRGERQPNIVLVLTDDQGYGDLGCHGNDRVITPNLDQLRAQGADFTRFYASPVCAPTRASLMTGRYNYRTGVVDTWLGRAMMHPDEVTIAEILRQAGYRTGVFGKWHLGDNHPMRPYERGFDEALVHKGGGIGQPADPPGTSYCDPILDHNGRLVRCKGYCTDIFTDACLRFIRSCMIQMGRCNTRGKLLESCKALRREELYRRAYEDAMRGMADWDNALNKLRTMEIAS